MAKGTWKFDSNFKIDLSTLYMGYICHKMTWVIVDVIHCKCIDCQKCNFSWCNISDGHLITVFNGISSCIFGNVFISYRMYFVHLKQCKNISKSKTFCGISHLQCITHFVHIGLEMFSKFALIFPNSFLTFSQW